MEQPLDFIRLCQLSPRDPESLSCKPGSLYRRAASPSGRQVAFLRRNARCKKRGQKRRIKNDMLVSLPDQRFCLIPRASTRNPEHDYEGPHLLGRDDSFPQILISTQKEHRGDGTLTSQGHQISDDQRINPLLLVPGKPPETKLHARQLRDAEMLLCRYGIWSGVVPVDPQDRQAAIVRGKLDQSSGQPSIVTPEVLPRCSPAAQLAPLRQEMPGIHEDRTSIHRPLKTKGPLSGPINLTVGRKTGTHDRDDFIVPGTRPSRALFPLPISATRRARSEGLQ